MEFATLSGDILTGYLNIVISILLVVMICSWMLLALLPGLKLWRFKHLMKEKLPLPGTTVQLTLEKRLTEDLPKASTIVVNGIESPTLCEFRGPTQGREHKHNIKTWVVDGKEEEWEAVGDYGDGGWGCFCCWPVSFRIFSFVKVFPGFE